MKIKSKFHTTLNIGCIQSPKSNLLLVMSYNELHLMVADLLKVSIMVLQNGHNNDINAMTLVEIALQLLRDDEMALLDDLHKIHLKA